MDAPLTGALSDAAEVLQNAPKVISRNSFRISSKPTLGAGCSLAGQFLALWFSAPAKCSGTFPGNTLRLPQIQISNWAMLWMRRTMAFLIGWVGLIPRSRCAEFGALRLGQLGSGHGRGWQVPSNSGRVSSLPPIYQGELSHRRIIPGLRRKPSGNRQGPRPHAAVGGGRTEGLAEQDSRQWDGPPRTHIRRPIGGRGSNCKPRRWWTYGLRSARWGGTCRVGLYAGRTTGSANGYWPSDRRSLRR